jgi:hypothetical protein
MKGNGGSYCPCCGVFNVLERGVEAYTPMSDETVERTHTHRFCGNCGMLLSGVTLQVVDEEGVEPATDSATDKTQPRVTEP